MRVLESIVYTAVRVLESIGNTGVRLLESIGNTGVRVLESIGNTGVRVLESIAPLAGERVQYCSNVCTRTMDICMFPQYFTSEQRPSFFFLLLLNDQLWPTVPTHSDF